MTTFALQDADQFFSGIAKAQTLQQAAPDLPTGPVMFGSVYYTADEDPAKHGIYALELKPNGKFVPVYLDPQATAKAGAIIDNGKYKMHVSDSRTGDACYRVYDMSSWACEQSLILPNHSTLAMDVAWDPVTGNVYGNYSNDNGSMFGFGYANFDTHSRTMIREIGNPWFGVAVNSKGEVYAINDAGKLMSVNKITGETREIGPTGISPKYYQSMAFDLDTDILYWAAGRYDGGTGLYQVDLTTGAATMLYALPNGAAVSGLCKRYDNLGEGTPAQISGFSGTFNPDQLTGDITFTLPSQDCTGRNLEGTLTYEIYVNAELQKTATGAPGSVQTVSISGKNGMNVISLGAINEAGRSMPLRIEQWIGYDAPAAIAQPKLVLENGNTLYVKWTAPTASKHGGTLDKSTLKYKLLRYPGPITISTGLKATEYRQKLTTTDGYTNYWYEVIPFSKGLGGDAVASNIVRIGNSMTLPYADDFKNSSTYNYYLNEGNAKWAMSANGAEVKSTNTPVDAWIFLPAFNLNTERSVKMTLTAASEAGPAEISMHIGTKPEAASMQRFDALTTKATAQVADTVSTFTYAKVPANGDCYIGLHATGDAGTIARILNIKVEDGPLATVPGLPGNLSIEALPKGELGEEFKFTAPVRNMNDEELQGEMTAVIRRNDTIVGTLPGIAPGAEASYIDRTGVQGFNTYAIAFENASGEGRLSAKKIFIGKDLPTAPTNVRIKDEGDRRIITWDAPLKGVNGGYIDEESLNYHVICTDRRSIADGLKVTQAVDLNQNIGRQHFVQYGVMALTEQGTSGYAASMSVVSGEPFTMPFVEGFPGGNMSNNFWALSTNSKNAFVLTNVDAADGDGGCAMYKTTAAGQESSLYTGKISMDGAERPVLSYYYKAAPGTAITLRTEISGPDYQKTVIKEVDLSRAEGNGDWRKVTLALDDFKELEWIQAHFYAVSHGANAVVKIDDCHVENMDAHNLVAKISAPTSVRGGDKCEVSVTVENQGYEPSLDYSVTLYCDGAEVATQAGTPLQSLETATYRFEVTATPFTDKRHTEVYGEINSTYGENSFSYITQYVWVNLKATPYPGVRNVSASQDAEPVISWDVPERLTLADGKRIDGAESYDSFIIDNVGDWTMVDRDGARTMAIGDGNGSYVAFPHAIEPKAFIVFNADDAGIPSVDDFGKPTKWAAYEGNQMFASFQASKTASDDWMI